MLSSVHAAPTQASSARSPGADKDTPYLFDDEANHDPTPYPEWFKKSFYDLKEDIADAKRTNKKGIMIFIGTRQCSYCKIFKEKTLSDKNIQSRLRSNFDSIGIEIFSDEPITDLDGKVYSSKDFVYHKNAHFSPTLIFYDTNGNEILKIVGYYPPNKFKKVLDFLIDGKYKEVGLGRYLENHEKNNIKSKLAIPKDRLFSTMRTNFNRTNRPSKKPLLLLLERSDCEACVRLHKNILSNAIIRQKLKDFELAQLDIDDNKTGIVTPDGKHTTPYKWAQKLKLQYTPAFLFFDKSGKLVLRQDSDVQAFRVKRMLKHVKNKVYLTETQFNRWLADEYRREHKTYKTSN